MERAQSVWKTGGSRDVVEPCFQPCTEVDQIIAEARKSQRQEKSLTDTMAAHDRQSSTKKLTTATSRKVRAWLTELRDRRTDAGKRYCNELQYEFVKKVAQRVMQELDEEGSCSSGDTEPLRWCLHGPPGTGKTHAIKIIRKELFEGLLGWDTGVQFQIVALQAVMAELLGGDTIHHACGIPAFRRNECNEEDLQRHLEVAKRVLQWRWLIVDEISMVSAKLLADMDVKLRRVIREIGTQKLANTGLARPFGGLNVICAGDFWQLDPPEGGFLGDIPTEYIQTARKYSPLPTVAHGQALMWSGPQTGIQGVTELIDCERCDDEWLREVQTEIREGCLSERNHAFLHGLPTDVAGSWCAGRLTCRNKDCKELGRQAQRHQTKETTRPRLLTAKSFIMQRECSVCKTERSSKRLVANSETDPRFQSERFIRAPAIFANNDLKYESNKLRASQYAAKTNKTITYSMAKDIASADALRERPDLPAQKLCWLQRHDRQSGDLYGALPLIEGMPVALTDHIDRSPQKQLLRGRVGYIHSWILQAEEKSQYVEGVRILHRLPKVVLVKFYDAEGGEVDWRLPGLNENGLYPITWKKRSWFLDKGRRHPVLRITRSQVPLAPAFAITAHASQGQTFKKGCIVDLRIGRGTSPVASYVALTRVKRREDLLIYRPFERELFTRAPRKGPELLLSSLRGERVEWAAIEAEYMPSARCAGCGFRRFKPMFAPQQWTRNSRQPYCKQCVERKKREGTPLQCNACFLWKTETAFEVRNRHPNCINTRICCDCEERRRCKRCGQHKCEKEFSASEWQHARWSSDRQGNCRDCAIRSGTGQWMCRGCRKQKDKGEFMTWLQTQKYKTQKKTSRCNTCVRQADLDRKTLATQNLAHVCVEKHP
jgi:hypothetical protein